MDVKKTFINFALLGLCILALFSFIIIFQEDNNATEKITDNAIINNTYGQLYGNLSNFEDKANKENSVFGEITPTESYGEVQIDSMTSPTKTLKAMVLGVYNVLIKLPSVILGVDPVVASIISGILIFALIVGIWAIWKGSISG